MMNGSPTAHNRIWIAGGFVAGILLMAAIVIAGTVWVQRVITPPPSKPPIVWVSDTYMPGEFCPGDIVTYGLGILVRTPGPLYVVSSVARADDHPDVTANRTLQGVEAIISYYGLPLIGDTVQARMLGDVPILVIDEPALLYDTDSNFTVPDLSPGPYERRIAAGIFGTSTAPAMRTQTFTIRDDCPGADNEQ